ncbi:hypothetical protein L227DRAFT_581031 [Lentinus tigrinus ALCF2SS1-6]|uniref:Uncharacterized protein n=1 Tax=Lentinus tigrinus ALCF2SS1-6 TaxID=1328759 RepID=A0A5C2RUL8_9APHY|nr:hypothetical protein L227DRAFT_581031 [Lentinus tigrinus ALCF2SS1-6]
MPALTTPIVLARSDGKVPVCSCALYPEAVRQEGKIHYPLESRADTQPGRQTAALSDAVHERKSPGLHLPVCSRIQACPLAQHM